MAPETPQIRDAIRRMRERGILIIPFISNQQNDEHFNQKHQSVLLNQLTRYALRTPALRRIDHDPNNTAKN